MKLTLTVIKADIGAVGGHVRPSEALLKRVHEVVRAEGGTLLIDHYIGFCGDDIHLLMSHTEGTNSKRIHGLAWEVFKAGTQVAKAQGLYGAGQDLLKDSFAGNVRGLGPGVAEMEIEERPNESFVMFAADKTEPGAFNLPLYFAFADPIYCPGLLLSPALFEGFTFSIMDVNFTQGDRVIQLHAPEQLYDIAALLRDNHRFVVEAIYNRQTGDQAVACSTSRLHHIAGKYVGKDDPAMLVRAQQQFPATGEIVAPFEIGHYVGGLCRGSHNAPLMPVQKNSQVAYFDGPPLVQALAFSIKDGKLTEPADIFDHPYWDWVRDKVAAKTVEMRRQGFSGPAMLGFEELEYGGITERLGRLDGKFTVRKER
jgi:fructose 1,6-bisphosphate aldolase/phosphatase